MLTFFKDIYKNRSLLFNFAWNDFKARYAGSFLGIFWAFIQPLVTIAVYWFVFDIGLKAGATDGGYPFIVFLVTGIIVWFYFSESIINCTNCYRDYSYLVKKVVFNIRILPTSKLIANIYPHIFFIGLALVLCAVYGYYPTLYTLQIFYYLGGLLLFLTGLTWITSSIQPFFPDALQFINVTLQVVMWATPILYSPTIFPPKVQILLRFNPLYYIVDGYRSAFLSTHWFWSTWKIGLYFWAVTILLLWIGSKAYNNLSQHFSDVL